MLVADPISDSLEYGNLKYPLLALSTFKMLTWLLRSIYVTVRVGVVPRYNVSGLHILVWVISVNFVDILLLHGVFIFQMEVVHIFKFWGTPVGI